MGIGALQRARVEAWRAVSVERGCGHEADIGPVERVRHTATGARDARPSHYWANTKAWTTCASMYATRGDTRSTRLGTDTRSGDRLPDQRHGARQGDTQLP